ncbi:MAG: hypothetical protein Q7J16_00640 [Candidatus Cloacimonadales bacterium]|nr:hypothetical protein [Candidatus Cloacimonadales bacterium]
MKTIKLQIMFLILACLSNVLCWGQAPGGKVPLNLEFSVSPIKDVYHPGDVITVDVYAYFFRELYEDEQNKEFLIIGKFTVGSIIHAFKSKPNNSVDKSILTITESTFSDTLIYLHDTSEEVRGSFKIVVQKEFVQLRLKASSYVLGEEYFNDKLISSSIIINGVKTHYIGHKFHKGYVIRPLKKIPKNDELNISDPQSQGYETIVSPSSTGNL